MIVFHNEPKLSEREADKNFNERRVSLAPQIKEFIANHELFKDKEIEVTFAGKGVSSLVCIIETPDEKLVLKIPLSVTGFSEGEAQFLNAWREAGVKVPKVIESGKLGDHSCTLMEYIEAPLLSEAYNYQESVAKGIYKEMGQILRLMHKPKTTGYGQVVEGKAQYSKFEDWLQGPDIQKRVSYLQESGLLPGQSDSAFAILTTYVTAQKTSSYCHTDFGTSNIFATNPITVFDPNPRFNNGYLDLGRSLVAFIAQGKLLEAQEQLLDGYFGGEPFNKQVLRASILVNACIKFPYWHKTGRMNLIDNVQEYLAKPIDKF